MAETIKSVVVLIITAIIYWLTKDYPPRSVIYIRLLLTILLGLSIIYFVTSLKEFLKNKESCKNLRAIKLNFSDKHKKLLSMILILFMYTAGLRYVGYYVSTLVFIWITMVTLGKVNIKSMLVLPLILLVSVYFFFDILLMVQLPAGLMF